jgi:hypothetical protein
MKTLNKLEKMINAGGYGDARIYASALEQEAYNAGDEERSKTYQFIIDLLDGLIKQEEEQDQ